MLSKSLRRYNYIISKSQLPPNSEDCKGDRHPQLNSKKISLTQEANKRTNKLDKTAAPKTDIGRAREGFRDSKIDVPVLSTGYGGIDSKTNLGTLIG